MMRDATRLTARAPPLNKNNKQASRRVTRLRSHARASARCSRLVTAERANKTRGNTTPLVGAILQTQPPLYESGDERDRHSATPPLACSEAADSSDGGDGGDDSGDGGDDGDNDGAHRRRAPEERCKSRSSKVSARIHYDASRRL